jgi:hypothetical protein
LLDIFQKGAKFWPLFFAFIKKSRTFALELNN